jgi:hypothetical protein
MRPGHPLRIAIVDTDEIADAALKREQHRINTPMLSEHRNYQDWDDWHHSAISFIAGFQ